MAALAVVAVLAVPGPCDPLALGHMARGGYGTIELGAMIVVFTLIKFALIGVPMIGYAISPTRTSAQISTFSNWMASDQLEVRTTVVGVIGFALIVRGIAG